MMDIGFWIWLFTTLFLLMGWLFAAWYPELSAKKSQKIPFTWYEYLIFGFGWLLDVFLNLTLMNLLLFPDFYPRELTISKRLARLANDRKHLASDRAYWIYLKFIHRYDPGHEGVIWRG